MARQRHYWNGYRWVPITGDQRRGSSARLWVALGSGLVALVAVIVVIASILVSRQSSGGGAGEEEFTEPVVVGPAPPPTTTQRIADGVVVCDRPESEDACFPEGSRKKLKKYFERRGMTCEDDVKVFVECEVEAWLDKYPGSFSLNYSIDYTAGTNLARGFRILISYGDVGDAMEGVDALGRILANESKKLLAIFSPEFPVAQRDAALSWLKERYAEYRDTCPSSLGDYGDEQFGSLGIGCTPTYTIAVEGKDGKPRTSISRDVAINAAPQR